MFPSPLYVYTAYACQVIITYLYVCSKIAERKLRVVHNKCGQFVTYMNTKRNSTALHGFQYPFFWPHFVCTIIVPVLVSLEVG